MERDRELEELLKKAVMNGQMKLAREILRAIYLKQLTDYLAANLK